MKKKIVFATLLILIFVLALFFRIYFSYDKVFSEPIKYSADDGVYHMRLVENQLLGNHFPKRIYFDAYTNFPYGSYVLFAPLYDYLLAGFIWLVSLGNPSLELINKIAPFYPSVLGSLAVFLVYFIAKAIWDRKTAFLSAFLITFYPSFLYKSLLGTTDHHVAEVLFSTLTMMFLIFSLKTRNKKQKIEINYKDESNNTRSFLSRSLIKIKQDFVNNKKFWLFIILTGLSLGLYFLTWNGALLFLFIIFLFIISHYLIEYFSGNFLNWILSAGIVIFLIVLLMIAAFFGHPDLLRANMYNIKHLSALIFGIFGFILIRIMAFFLREGNKNKWYHLFLLFLAIILIIIILNFFSPSIFNSLFESFKAINNGGSQYKFARELVSEMHPLGLKGAFAYFSASFYLSLIALCFIIYAFIKKKKPEYLLVIIWSLIIILVNGIIPFWGQRRFNYYLAVNISLLSSFLVIKGLKFGWKGLRISQRVNLNSSFKNYFLLGSILIIFNSIFFLIFPFPFNIGDVYPENLPDILKAALITAKNGVFRQEDDWYETLGWLRENTPDLGVDYYALYQEPGLDKKNGKINSYSYPLNAYGVLAEWDVGHMITYYAHRIPNSNPFQQGVGKKEGEDITEIGEGIFFLETEEEKAAAYLDELKTRYVMTSYYLASPDGLFRQKVKWIQGDLEGYLEDNSSKAPSKFDNSMIAKMHILDGREETTEREVNNEKIKFHIKSLSRFRLIYESKRTVAFSVQNPGVAIKAIKIFEYLKGAKIKGKTKPETEVIIFTEIETNQARKFIYQKSVKTKDGNFEFIVPYSTFGESGRLSEESQFVVFAQPYKIKIGTKEIKINVTERDVLEGKEIKITNNSF